MNDLEAMVTEIVRGNLDAAGPLADYLDEHNDPRGKLLRRRWKMWSKDRLKAADYNDAYKRQITEPWSQAIQSLRDSGFEVECNVQVEVSGARISAVDASFKDYVYERFCEEFHAPAARRLYEVLGVK